MRELNQGWYNLGENTQYPFDQGATLQDDAGLPLPCSILADFSITLPKSLGQRVYCSGISKQGSTASLVFAGDAEGLPTVAAVTIGLGAERRKPVMLESIEGPVRGAVVPGELLWELEDGTWRFTNPSQSYMAARTVFPVSQSRQQELRLAYGALPLQSVLKLSGDVNVRIALETRLLGGKMRPAVVASLFDLNGQSALKAYAGKYQQRPESRTCGDPAPVETINLIQPDCCGRIFFELRGCAKPIPISNHCGVVLDCPMEASEMCSPRELVPDESVADYCQTIGKGADPIDPASNAPQQPPWWSDRA